MGSESQTNDVEPAKMNTEGSLEPVGERPSGMRSFDSSAEGFFDSRELFMHVYQNPADIPLTIKWGEELFPWEN